MHCSCFPTLGEAGISERIACLIGKVSQKLMVANQKLGTAESCTGGLLAACCTDVSGSSAWFTGSVVAYANTIKERLLDVSDVILAEHGAVSKETVESMAKGALKTLGVDVAISVSGVAGPTGGTPQKPVGTVWIAVAAQNGTFVQSRCFCFSGDREGIRLQAVEQGLEMALLA